jgi:2-keto-4-pentenoate hydratase/2-oxohepta-3-ene-1,7-dioic acid hydratase in catechol pathway
MRLVTYETDWGSRAGVVVDGRVLDAERVARAAGLASEGDARWTSNRQILGAGAAAVNALARAAAAQADRDEASVVGSVEGLRLGPPILDPDKIICLGLNYRDHADEAGLEVPTAPMLFAKFRNSLVGPADPIVLPASSEVVDYEAELAVVIGRRCKDLTEDEALSAVVGVMALNDVSARDLQNATSQWMAGKAIDTFAPCGPALVLLDELDDLQDLSISARVNGETVQDANTSLMIFSVAETVAFVSRLMTLEPGDIIATGTPAGVGFKRDPQVLLRPGDVVEVEIGGIGILRNPVVAGPESDTVPSASALELEEAR